MKLKTHEVTGAAAVDHGRVELGSHVGLTSAVVSLHSRITKHTKAQILFNDPWELVAIALYCLGVAFKLQRSRMQGGANGR